MKPVFFCIDICSIVEVEVNLSLLSLLSSQLLCYLVEMNLTETLYELLKTDVFCGEEMAVLNSAYVIESVFIFKLSDEET